MLKVPTILKMFFDLRGLIPRGTTFKFENLREFGPEFKNVLGYESQANMGSIHEKTRVRKSHATVSLNTRMRKND